MYLEQEDEIVFTSTRECVGEDIRCAVFTLRTDGDVKGRFNDTNTGFVIKYREHTGMEEIGRKWTFYISHVHIIFEAPDGSGDEYSRFVNTARGGEIGKLEYKGQTKSEQNKVSRNISLM